MKTAIHTWPLRDLEEPLAETVERASRAGLDGVELLDGVPPVVGEPETVDATRAALEETGLAVPAARTGLDTLLDDPAPFLQTYGRLGADVAVVPGFDDERLADPESIRELGDDLGRAADRLADRNWGLCFHNHGDLFERVEGEFVFDRLLAATPPAVGVELDLAWAAIPGGDPAAILDERADRIELVHVTDADLEAGTDVEVGTGDLDLPALADAAREAGVEWLSYDYDDPEDPAEAIEHAGRVLGDLAAE